MGGVTAYAVVRRRREIGIRMALGAGSREVQGLVMREGTALVAVGWVLGLGGGYALWRALSTFSDVLARSFSKHADDSLLLFGASLVLAGLAMLACYRPARRATAIDPCPRCGKSEWKVGPALARAGHARSRRAHYGREEWVEKDEGSLRVAGLPGLVAVRIGHPMI